MNRSQQKPTQVSSDGKLVSPNNGFKSLIRLVLRKPVEEKTAVKIIWIIGIIFGLIGIMMAFLMPGVLGSSTLAQFMGFKEILYQV